MLWLIAQISVQHNMIGFVVNGHICACIMDKNYRFGPQNSFPSICFPIHYYRQTIQLQCFLLMCYVRGMVNEWSILYRIKE